MVIRLQYVVWPCLKQNANTVKVKVATQYFVVLMCHAEGDLGCVCITWLCGET